MVFKRGKGCDRHEKSEKIRRVLVKIEGDSLQRTIKSHKVKLEGQLKNEN